MFEQTILERKKELIIGVGAFIGGVLLLIVYFQSGPDATAYTQAEAAFEKWEASPQDEALYAAMRQTAKKVPSLVEKYETAIAQTLLSTDKTDQALGIAYRALNRVKDEVPYHSAYAANSLLIEQGLYQEALEKSVALKEEMKDVPSNLLYAHNLLRIATLQQELSNRPGEKAAWEELEAFLKNNQTTFEAISSHFSDAQVNLIQYIAERKKHL